MLSKGQKQLRIAFVGFFHPDFGTYGRSSKLARALVERGHHVTLFCASPEKRWRPKQYVRYGIEHVECPAMLGYWPVLQSGNSPLDIAWRIYFLCTRDYDVVQGFEHFGNVSLPIWVARRRRRFLYVSDWCDWVSEGLKFTRSGKLPFARQVVSTLEDRARSFADGVTVISQCLYEHVLSLGFDAERVLLLPNGSPVDWLHPLPKAEARRRLGLPEGMRCLGIVGTLNVLALRQFAEPIADLCQAMPDLRILLVGRYGQSRYAPVLEAHGLGEHLIVPGWVAEEDLPWYMAACDVFLNPLTPDRYDVARGPEKTGAYLAAGRPVVISDVGDDAHLIRDQQVGLVVDNTREDIRGKIRLLLTATELASEMGAKARQVAEQHAWRYRAAKLEAFYLRLLWAQPNAFPHSLEGEI